MGYFFIICKENPNKRQIEVEGDGGLAPKKRAVERRLRTR